MKMDFELTDEMLSTNTLYRMVADAHRFLDSGKAKNSKPIDTGSAPMVMQVLSSLEKHATPERRYMRFVEALATTDGENKSSSPSTIDIATPKKYAIPQSQPSNDAEGNPTTGLAEEFENIGIGEEEFLELLKTRTEFFLEMSECWFGFSGEEQTEYPGGMFEFMAKTYKKTSEMK